VVDDAYPLIAVVGPTGSGKSELALRLAREFHGEIVNCDSVQVYRWMDIGSAKTPATRRGGILHHLLDVIHPAEELTAGDYARQAGEVLEQIHARGALPVVAGGTGFYLRALLDGLSPAPARNEELRARLNEVWRRRPTALQRFLRRRNPAAAARIHGNDRQKLMRAIELGAGAALPRQALQGFRTLKIGLNPERCRLYEKLNERTAWMFENGLLTETKALLDAGVPPSAKALGTLGYRQAVKVLTLGLPLADAVADCQTRTRQYAKRQMTWFRAQADIHWLNGFGEDAGVQQEADRLVGAFLARDSPETAP
jgi:tRNA dimethylallyltransferase